MDNNSKPSILYVDDESGNLISFEYLFQEHYQVHIADSAQAGYELVQMHDIPLIIADQRMPNVTGVEFLTQIHQDFPDTIRMILTGYSDFDAIIEAINKGKIYYYLQKPWEEQSLKLVIDHALEVLTLQQEVQVQADRFRNTFEHAGIGIAHIDASGRFIRVNQEYCNLVGYTKAELSNLNIQEITYQGDATVETAEIQAVLAGLRPSFSTEKRLVRKDGTIIWIQLTATSVRDSATEPRYLISAVSDITRRKEAEEALKQERASLAQQVAEQTDHLRQANAELARVSRMKDTFLANMSHELRTPLNGILGYTAILKRRTTNKDFLDGLMIIQESGEHLLTLINDILDFSKIEAGKLELHPEAIHLPSFLRTIDGIIRSRIKNSNVSLAYSIPPNLPDRVLVDGKHLRQVLLNLLSNAVKFTQIGYVTLNVEILKIFNTEATQQLAQFRFSVEDTGIGINSEQQDKIFRPFEQANQPHKWTEGTGLGLAISQEIVNLMGGELQVKSKLKQGSTFWFEITLPIIEMLGDEQPIQPKEIIGYQGQFRKILVVDDKSDNRRVLFDMLTPLGFEIFMAEDGLDGLNKAHEIQPDLILMDMVMPVMSGSEVIKQIRQTSEIQDIPIIIVSASILEDDINHRLQGGYDAFLLKPIQINQLFHLLEKHLQLEWIYASSSEGPSSVSGETKLVPPPSDELQTLYDLALFGSMERIEEQASQLAEIDVAYAPFVHRIQTLARNFEDEKIIALLEEFMK